MSRHRSPRAPRASRPLTRQRLQVEALEDRRLMAIAIAENLLINLDARDPSAGTAVWDNTGSTAGDFAKFGNPTLVNLGPNANPAVSFNQTPNGDYYRGPVSPDGIEGAGTRSIEVWTFNPTLERGEETLVSWGRRGEDRRNMSFNYGTDTRWGGVGHWGTDLGWNGNPEGGTWHHLAYTYDGTASRIYSDGVLKNTVNVSLDTFQDYSILLAAQHTNGSATPGTADISDIMGTMSLGTVRIHDGVLTPGQIVQNFNEEATRFGRAPLQAAPAPVHRYSFTADGTDSIGGANATLLNGASISGGELVLINTTNSDNANGQYATLPIGATLGRSNELTVEGWFTLTASANWQRLYDFGFDQDRYMFFTPTSGAGGNPSRFGYENGAGTEQVIDSPTTPLNVQVHVVTVIDVSANVAKLYINGQLVGSDFGITPFSPIAMGSTTTNYLGRSFFGGDALLRGRINELRIYDDALDGDQVRGNFAAGPDALNTAPTPVNDNYTTTETTTINPTQFIPPTTSHFVPVGTIGGQDYGGPLGLDFNVITPVTVSHLGVFDSGSDGLTTTITASLHDRNNPATPLATLTFTQADPGTLEGGSRLKLLATPITLPAGFQGTIVAKGFNASNLNGNNGTPVWTTNSGGGALAFVGQARFGAVPDSYPGNLDGGPVNRYAAGTFKFVPVGAPQSLLANDTDPQGQGLRVVPSYPTTIINANFDNNQVPSNVLLNRNTGAAGQIQNGRLELTQAVNGHFGAAIVSKPNPLQLLQGFNATFDILLGNGTNPPADGATFAYGVLADNALFGENIDNFAGLQVQFDSFDNGGGEGPAFELVYNNALLKRIVTPTVINNGFVPVSINVTPDGIVTLRHNNSTIFEVQIPLWNPQANWRFGIGGRTGGLNAQTFVDNLNITGLINTTTSAAGVSVTVNADGTFSYDPTGVPAFNALSAGQTQNDTFTYAVSDGALISTATATITIVGVNDPVTSANAGGPYVIDELEDLTLQASGIDPDTNDALTFTWDLDGDGFDDATGANPTVSWTTLTNLTPAINDQGSRTIRVRATDASGTFADASTTLTIVNAAPILTVTGPTQAAPGVSVDFDFATLDAPADMAAGFRYEIDWDGNLSIDQVIVNDEAEITVPHVFNGVGTFDVRVTARDKDGAVSAVATHQIQILQVFEQDGVLIIGGTGLGERIVVQPAFGGGVQVRINNKIMGTFGDFTEVEISGGGGNDNITVASSLQIAFTIDGGEGNDYIVGGPLEDTIFGGPGSDRIFGVGGDDIIEGGDGNDTISGGFGMDILHGDAGNDVIRGEGDDDQVHGDDGNDNVQGGAGNDLVRGGDGLDTVDGGTGDDALAGDAQGDRLTGGTGNDVLIGGDHRDTIHGGLGEDLIHGGTLADDSDEALLALLLEWNSGAAFADRVEMMLPQLSLDAVDDEIGDTFNGERGDDWYLIMLNDFVHASDRKLPNILTPLPPE